MKLFLILFMSIVGLVALVFVVGWFLPSTREGRAEISIAAPPDRVMAVMTDVVRQPDWRKGIASVELNVDGWVETTTRGEVITFAWSLREPLNLALTFRSDAGYSGEWQSKLTVEEKATRVTVIERSAIKNPFQRLIARLVFDPETFAMHYLENLKAEAER